MWHIKQHFTDERLTSSVLSFSLSHLLTYTLLSCGYHHSLNDCRLLWRNAQSFEMCYHKPSLKHIILVSGGEGEAEGEGK